MIQSSMVSEVVGNPNGLWTTKMSVKTAEKFAELIIRECCIALNPMLRDMISRGQGVDMIKQHFGVEL